MSDNGSDVDARMERVKRKLSQRGGMPGRREAGGIGAGRRRAAVDADDGSLLWILKVQFAFVLGFAGLILGRAVAMRGLGLAATPDVLGRVEGLIVLGILLVLGLLMGPKDFRSHAALVIGAGLAFMAEGLYIPLVPALMSQIYTPEYVGLVVLGH